MIRVKDHTVNMVAVRPQIFFAIVVFDQVAEEKGVPDGDGYHTTITSLNDGKHSATSLHYDGAGADLRSRHLTDAMQQTIAAETRKRLGQNFDVIVEKDHFHIEWQPRKPA